MRNLLACYIVILFLSGCKKQIVVVPEACLQSNATEVKVAYEITFTNCSHGAKTVWLDIYTPGKKPLTTSPASFDTENKYTHKFSEVGEYVAVLSAWGDSGAPTDTAYIEVKVLE